MENSTFLTVCDSKISNFGCFRWKTRKELWFCQEFTLPKLSTFFSVMLDWSQNILYIAKLSLDTAGHFGVIVQIENKFWSKVPSGEACGSIAFMRLKLKQGSLGSIRLTIVLADLSQVFSGLEQSVILNLLQVETRRNSKATHSSDSSPKKNPVFKAEFKTKILCQ